MKTAFSLLVFGSVAFGQSFQTLVIRNETTEQALQNSTELDMPKCGQLCFAQILPDYNCQVDDATCICPNANLTNDLSACTFSNCTIPDQLLVEDFSKTVCGAISRNDSGTTRSVTWGLFSLAVLFVASRFFSRPEKFKGSGYGTDDWTILGCVALLIPFNTLSQTMADSGMGADNYTLSATQITTTLKMFYVFQILYCMIVFLTKISILQLYLRIWTKEAVSRWFRRTCWILIGINSLTMLGFGFSLVAQCSPVSYAWTFWDGLHAGACVDRPAQIYVLGAFNITYDVFVFVLPLHNFLKLNIGWRRKFGVCLVFMVGLLVTVCSVIRLQYLVKIGVSDNPTWDYNSSVIWSVVECNVSVVCTCMPAAAGLLQRGYAALTGNPLSVSESESKAPINPDVIDPENPVGSEDMLHMREASSLADESMTTYHESEHSAPTEKLQGSQMTPTQNGIEIRHHPPSEAAATEIEYRDGEGRLHKVKVIDRPTDDIVTPDTAVPKADMPGGRF